MAVNDVLLPIWNLIYDILLLFGGRGGGKSEAVCDKLIDSCLNDEYFKCYYGRKVFDTVRGSCFATLIDCLKKNKVDHLFTFSEAENSSMIIRCKANGNSFLPFGSDKADKLKSIKDPTHIWCEEFDQFTIDDFKNLYPTLRTLRGSNKLIGTFNTNEVIPTHWILKVFFPDKYDGDDKNDVKNLDLLEGKKIERLFVNFTDNYFINREEYAKTLLLSAAGNLTIYEGIARGAWGVSINNSPWLHAFDRAKHEAPAELFADPRYELYLSFDFNRNPHACTVIQWPDKSRLQIIEVIKKENTGTERMCDIILAKYPGFVFIVTGDYTGNTDKQAIFQEYTTNYTMIMKKLNLSKAQVQIEPNPPLESNQTLVNAVFYGYTVEVCPVKARPFIFDAEKVKMRADGTLMKTNRDDPAQQADVLDTVRYWINKYMKWFIKVK